MKPYLTQQPPLSRFLINSCIAVVVIAMSGCTPIRTSAYRMQPDGSLITPNQWRNLQCGEKTWASVRHQWHSQRFFLGLGIPLIPLRERNSGDFQVEASELLTCPILQQKEVSLSGRKDTETNICYYNRHKLDLEMETQIIGQSSQGECTTKPFFYKHHIDWAHPSFGDL